ncbi:MAG: hypothetical protein U0R64_02320 [Candidatus Nanopelagicales bacterium]
MTVAPGIGRTLARLASLTPRRDGAIEPTDSRAQILELIRAADGPVSVEWLCGETELHANTVRGHLEVLLAAGQIVREPAKGTGRGRPPMLYRAENPRAVLYAELVDTLARQIGDGTDPALVDDAARRWAEVSSGSAGPADSIDEAIGQAVTALDELGFSAEVSPVGDSVTLSSCPYAELVRDQPVICQIHTALLRDLLDRTGQPVGVGDMEVFPAPGVCRAHLVRPDRQPEWVVPAVTPAPPKPRSKKNRKSS